MSDISGALVSVLLVIPFFARGFLATHRPKFHPGSEFPGATGSVEVAANTLRLAYDFSKGGHYVAAQFGLPERPEAREVAFEADCGVGAHVTLRFVDATGQTFQRYLPGETDGWESFVCRMDGGNAAHWGGANDGVFHQPLTGFTVIADNLTPGMADGGTGTLQVRNVRFSKTPSLAFVEQPRPNRPFGDLVAEAGRLRDDLARVVPSLEKKGLGAKTRATLNVMDSFFPWILEDVARGLTNRAVRETWVLIDIGRAARTRLERIRKGEETDAPVPHYVTSPIEISHAQTVALREWPDGRRERGNVMLSGFGHFGRVRRELDKLPPLGNHILQMEVGPCAVLPTETTVNTNALKPFFETAARAAKENVQICLLLSPHYFPDWAAKKHPHLADCTGGFFTYCVYSPEARAVLEKSLRAVIPLVRGNPALHSICLSNEPEQGRWGDRCALRPGWPGWLARAYGSVTNLNARWGTSYLDFASVASPTNFSRNASSPATLEWIRYSRAAFTEFHAWMAGIVHELAPEIPVHSKIMIFAGFGDSATYYSVDPDDFAQFSQYNGNDACDWPVTDVGSVWAHHWWEMEAGYDYQRSCADKPVFNTENHIIRDRTVGGVPARHTYTVLWQNAVHGQAATTLWCWERAYDDGKSDFNGLFLERPSALEVWAHTSLDLSRLVDVLAPIQNQEPTVLVHASLAAQVLRGRRSAEFLRAYRALVPLGQPLGVVTDRMLETYARTGVKARPLAAARAVVLPLDGPFPASVRAGLDRLAGNGVAVVRPDAKLGEKSLGRFFEQASSAWGLPDYPRVTAVDAPVGVRGGESRGYRADGKGRLTVVNHTNRPQKIRLPSAGRGLIAGTAVPAVLDLQPLRPLLVEF